MSMRSAASLLLGATIIAVACGPATPAATSAPTTAPTAAAATATPAAATKVRMNTFATCGEPWNWWAQDKGIYTKYGLDVEQVRTTGGGAAVAAVVSGAVEFGYVNPMTAMIAYNQGFPIQFVANAAVAAFPPLPSAQGMWVKSDSAIRTPADLKGKKVGVNEIGGINQIVTAAWLKAKGIDPTDVRFVALPFPQLLPAVVQGALDAAQTPYSFSASAGGPVRTIADPFVESGSRVMIAGYVAHKDYVAKNPKVVENFNLAIKEAIAFTGNAANKDAVYDVMARGCKGDATALKALPDNAQDAVVNMTTLGQMAQFLVDQRILGALPDLNGLVPEYARR